MHSRMISLLLLTLGISALTACTPSTLPPPTEIAVPAVPTPFLIPYCEVLTTDLCLAGFGQDEKGNLLILFKAGPSFPVNFNIFLEFGDKKEHLKCYPSETPLGGIFCLAGQVAQNTKIKLNVYRGEVLIAKGTFIVEHGPTSLSTATPTMTSTVLGPSTPLPTLTPSYPGPSYP